MSDFPLGKRETFIIEIGRSEVLLICQMAHMYDDLEKTDKKTLLRLVQVMKDQTNCFREEPRSHGVWYSAFDAPPTAEHTRDILYRPVDAKWEPAEQKP